MSKIDMTKVVTAEDKAAAAGARHKRAVTAAIDARIEAQARAMDYASSERLAGYSDSTVDAWRAEARAFIAWRDSCWVAALDMLAAAEDSNLTPSAEDVLGALPEWPGV